MLVFSRQVNQAIVIGKPPDQWTVTVWEISGDKVRVGIKSPDRCASPSGSSPVKRADAIELSPDIAITIIDIRGEKVRIGVNAPRTCTVHRLETLEAIQREHGESGE